MTVHYAALSQSSTDTICFARGDAMRVLTAARQKAVLDSVIVRMNADIQNYEIAINGLQIALTAYAGKDSAVTASYAREIGILNDQKRDYNDRVKVLEKQLKRANAGKKWTALTGLLVAAGLGYLLITK